MTYLLGKLEPREDTRTLRLASYLDRATLPSVPTALDLTGYVHQPWPMDGNDRLGDCTIAAAAHMVQLWSAMTRLSEVVFPEQLVESVYMQLTGGHDTGLACLDVLNFWRQNGIGGQHILAFASVAPKNRLDVKLALDLFGGSYLGVQLPISAQLQTGPGKTWRSGRGKTAAPGSWGGHCVPIVAYDGLGVSVVTWGFVQKMTWAFVSRYVDECWALLPQDFMQRGNPVSGFDFAALQADLAQIGTEG